MVKNLPASARDGKRPGSIPGWGRSPGGGQGNPLQYSCLENSLDRGAWWVTVHRVTKSWTQLKRLITACIQQFMNQAASYVVTRMALQRLVRNGSFIFLLEDSCFTICVSFCRALLTLNYGSFLQSFQGSEEVEGRGMKRNLSRWLWRYFLLLTSLGVLGLNLSPYSCSHLEINWQRY